MRQKFSHCKCNASLVVQIVLEGLRTLHDCSRQSHCCATECCAQRDASVPPTGGRIYTAPVHRRLEHCQQVLLDHIRDALGIATRRSLRACAAHQLADLTARAAPHGLQQHIVQLGCFDEGLHVHALVRAATGAFRRLTGSAGILSADGFPTTILRWTSFFLAVLFKAFCECILTLRAGECLTQHAKDLLATSSIEAQLLKDAGDVSARDELGRLDDVFRQTVAAF
mmetsp:Transcript_2114/g.3518  ORF Transcript_2114/g.3518 Transcript_2114/m.3518 type:complete len:226 (+) Transcript_2114:248-925(+)